MGNTNMCCAIPTNHISVQKYIYQINRYYDGSSLEESKQKLYKKRSISIQVESKNSTKNETENDFSQTDFPVTRMTTIDTNNVYLPKIENLSPKNGIFEIISFNINQNKLHKFYIRLPIISSIEGLSEITILTDFYLCGISQNRNDEGSFLIKINTIKNISSQLMISSQFTHVYPSLISDKKNQIICIGGKNQTQCELYSSKLERWFTLPNLPEERYKCTLCIEPKGKFLYLFGGFNSNNNEIVINNILRLHLIKQVKWEIINLEKSNNNKLIKKINAGAFCFEENEDDIFIIGGENERGKLLNDIIHFSISNLKFNICGNKLKYKCKFFNQYGLQNMDDIYNFIDSNNRIHEIDKHDIDSELFGVVRSMEKID